MSTDKKFTEFYNDVWQNWNEFVRYYPASIHRRKFILNELAKLKDWHSLADFGCGNALLIYSIYEKYNNPTRSFHGVDVSNEQIEKNLSLFPGVSFECADFATTAIDKQFDVITCAEVLEHIPDYKQAIKNIAKALKPGGVCIITVPKGEIFPTEQVFGHLRHFFKKDLIKDFDDCGIKCEKCISWGFPFHDLAKYAANVNPRGTIGKYATGGYLPLTSKIVFKLVNLFYYCNILPFGKQIFYIGRKA